MTTHPHLVAVLEVLQLAEQLKELIEAQAETKMRQGGMDVQAARLRARRA